METKIYVTFSLILLSIIACDPEEVVPSEMEKQIITEIINDTTVNKAYASISVPLQPNTIEKAVQVQKKKKKRKKKVYSAPIIVQQVKDSIIDRKVYHVSEQIIDSLIEEANHIDFNQYGTLALSYFGDLSSQLHGSNYYAENASKIMDAITDILTNKLVDGTDLVLLIDKTGSMADDLEAVKNGLEMIHNIIKGYETVNVAIASFSDKNWHGELWFNMSELDNNIDKLTSFMETYTIIGNRDTPESVNDAIVEVVDQTEWTPGNNRMILVIGDAPSQIPPYSDFTTKQVVQHCDSMDVTFNLYPIIIGANNTYTDIELFTKLDINLYPNPASEIVAIDTQNEDSYTIEMYDINGKKVRDFYTDFTGKTTLNVGEFQNGAYFLMVYNFDRSKEGFVKLIVSH